MTFLRIAAVTALAAIALYACASTSGGASPQPAATIDVPPGAPPVASDTPNVVRPRPAVSAEPAPAESAADVKPPSGDGRCGCAPCEPIKSTDACQSDADCAPSSVCHAPACVAKSKAPVKTPGTMCTMNLVCRTTDVGKCACVDNVCALVAR